MDNFLVHIICDDISKLYDVNKNGVQLLENTLHIKNKKIYIKAILEKELIGTIKSICDVEIIASLHDLEGQNLANVNVIYQEL